MDVPESMKAELQAWNGGNGIDLESWIGCQGSFSLAIGYATLFWPDIVRHRGYLLTGGFSEESLASFEGQQGATRKSVEWVMNHLHIADIQYWGCPDISRDKVVALGRVLQEIYSSKLRTQFPDLPCVVEFSEPEDKDDLVQYQLSFWQVGGENLLVTPASDPRPESTAGA